MSSESFTDAATSSQSIGIVRKENESIKRLNTQVWQQGTCTYLACGVHVPSGNTMVVEISILQETAILVLQSFQVGLKWRILHSPVEISKQESLCSSLKNLMSLLEASMIESTFILIPNSLFKVLAFAFITGLNILIHSTDNECFDLQELSSSCHSLIYIGRYSSEPCFHRSFKFGSKVHMWGH